MNRHNGLEFNNMIKYNPCFAKADPLILEIVPFFQNRHNIIKQSGVFIKLFNHNP